jgi:hypothetical protein
MSDESAEDECHIPQADVVTWSTPSGDTLNITPDQAERLEKRGIWPKNARGEEYCQILHGLHWDFPAFDHEVGL